MAETDFPLSMDRRRLLVLAAALPATGIVPGVKRAEPLTLADAAQPLSPPPTVPALRVSAATARRLLEIARRNKLRLEANLPLLSVAKELRRMKAQDDLQEFERFAAVRRKAILEEVIRPRREAEGNSNWRPSWMEAGGYQNLVHQMLWEEFRATMAT